MLRTVSLLSVAMGAVSVLFWLASYAWIVGLALPTEQAFGWETSPWLVAELAAIGTGVVGLLLAGMAATSAGDARRFAALGAVLSAFSVALSTLSLLMPS